MAGRPVNAGIFEVGSLDKTSLDDIERNLAVNVKAVVLANRASFRISDREVVSSTSAVALLPECLVQASHCMR
jgi:NADP-dependent 3-hydroxy acid dehydrogenase YdfG